MFLLQNVVDPETGVIVPVVATGPRTAVRVSHAAHPEPAVAKVEGVANLGEFSPEQREARPM